MEASFRFPSRSTALLWLSDYGQQVWTPFGKRARSISFHEQETGLGVSMDHKRARGIAAVAGSVCLCLMLVACVTGSGGGSAERRTPRGYSPQQMDRAMVYVPGGNLIYGMTAEQKLTAAAAAGVDPDRLRFHSGSDWLSWRGLRTDIPSVSASMCGLREISR